jgi:hypothetical protein
LGVLGRAFSEAKTVVSGLQNMAMVRQAIQQRCGHLGVAKDAGRFVAGALARIV